METTGQASRPQPAAAPPGVYNFSFPTGMRFGVGAIKQLPQEVRKLGQHPLVVTDPGLRKLPVFAGLEALLQAAGLPFAVYSEVTPNPGEPDVTVGVHEY